MKYLLAACAAIVLATSPSFAYEKLNVPAFCDTTPNVLKAMKDDQSEPVIVSRVAQVFTIVWINKNDDVTVTRTVDVDGKITCIVAAGTEDTWIQFPAAN